MNTISANIPRPRHTLITIVIIGTLALSLAAIATLGAENSGTSGGMFGTMGDYVATMTEGLASG